MSSFRGLDLFGSGPHRFAVLERGQETQPLWRLFDNPLLPGSQAIGDRDFGVVVTGRLVAGTEAALWALREAVAGEAEFADGVGTLVDNGGRSFAGLRLVSYVEEDRVDRGRVWSVGYTATFARVLP